MTDVTKSDFNWDQDDRITAALRPIPPTAAAVLKQCWNHAAGFEAAPEVLF